MGGSRLTLLQLLAVLSKSVHFWKGGFSTVNLKTKSSTMPHPCGCQSKAHRDVLANGLTAKMETELESLCLFLLLLLT